jgi:DNA polymerase-3 subunit epsilon/CBS domain-containing protein
MNGRELVARLWPRRGTDDRTPLDALFEPGFVAIDLETTGLDARRDVVVSVAAIPFERGRACEGFVSLVAPGRPIPPAATAIHGIDDAAVAGAPPIGEVLPRFHAVCGRKLIVGHDVGFDVSVLARSRCPLAAPAWAALDTRRLARALGYRDTRLERLAASVRVAAEGRHTADGDARMAGEILLALIPALRSVGVRTLGELRRLQRSASLHD